MNFLKELSGGAFLGCSFLLKKWRLNTFDNLQSVIFGRILN